MRAASVARQPTPVDTRAMALPRSTFASPVSNSAWFTSSDGNTWIGNGKSVISDLQQKIKTVLTAPTVAFDGTQVTGAIITRVDGVWGPATYRALSAFVRHLTVSPNDQALVDDGARRNTITRAVLQIALQASYRINHPGVNVQVPADAIPPTYNVDPGGDISRLTGAAVAPDQLVIVGGLIQRVGGAPADTQPVVDSQGKTVPGGISQLDASQFTTDTSSTRPLAPEMSLAVTNQTPVSTQGEIVSRTSAPLVIAPAPAAPTTARKIPWVPIGIGAGAITLTVMAVLAVRAASNKQDDEQGPRRRR